MTFDALNSQSVFKVIDESYCFINNVTKLLKKQLLGIMKYQNVHALFVNKCHVLFVNKKKDAHTQKFVR